MTPFVLGVVGDSGSGKSTVAKGVIALLGPERVTDLKLDDYQRFTREERKERGVTALNPVVHNLPLMAEHLQLLRSGRPIRNRSYEHSDGSFGPIRTIEPSEIVLVRGLLGYASDELRSLYDLTVFLAPDPELLFRWKLRRDVHSRGYSEAEVLAYIARHLLDSKQFVLPQAERSDVVVCHSLDQWDDPDERMRTRVRLRGEAAERAREGTLLGPLAARASLRTEDGTTVLELPADLSQAEVSAWAAERFPRTHQAPRVGAFRDASGELSQDPKLSAVEVLIAALVQEVGNEL